MTQQQIDDDIAQDDDDNDGDDAGVDCGLVVEGGREICLSAGTEWCDWDCPYNSVQQATIRRQRRAKAPGPLLQIMEKDDA